jgi:hypothetical protein
MSVRINDSRKEGEKKKTLKSIERLSRPGDSYGDDFPFFPGGRMSGAFRDSAMRGIRRITERDPAFGPASDLAQRVLQLATLAGKLVLNANGSFGDHMSRKELFGLE